MSSLISVSQKCQYALRALFELALRYPQNSVITVSEIAKLQNIPLRFLEQILSKLKTGGYIKSKRGNQGGYVLAVSPSLISVGEIISFIEGTDESIICLKKSEIAQCAFVSRCVFKDLWHRAKSALSEIFDEATFQDLIDNQTSDQDQLDFSI